MARTKTKALPQNHMPVGPWIYINDPSDNAVYASKLDSLMPKSILFRIQKPITKSSPAPAIFSRKACHDKIVLIADDANNGQGTQPHSNAMLLKQAAIKNGCNFASINLYRKDGSTKKDGWGTNHLAICIGEEETDAQMDASVQKIYQWLFSVFTVLEQLHLIPDEQMKQSDRSTAFKEYDYCPISESRSHPRDAKLQFVALILTKPVVGPNKRVSWQVADKTGTANFYFQYRGPSSQYTWDWVLALQPGDRKCLPRMPMVQIKERKRATIVKAPFRVTGAIISGTGCVLKAAGHGLQHVGGKVKLGQRSKWVPEADVTTDSNGRVIVKPSGEDEEVVSVPTSNKKQITIFTEKGDKVWKDSDSIASTTAGSDMEEKNPLNLI